MTRSLQLNTLFVLVFLNARTNSLLCGQAQDLYERQVCAEKTIFRCYASYLPALTSSLLGPAAQASIKSNETAHYVRACSLLKARLPCHRRMEHCSKYIKEEFIDQEKSYRYIKDTFCARSTTRDRTRRFAQAIKDAVNECVDTMEFLACKLKKLKDWDNADRSDISPGAVCKFFYTTAECFQNSMKPKCGIPYELFKSKIELASSSLARLAGCTSTGSSQLPRAYVLVLAVLLFGSWFRE
ncbi:uncharacterized protein LOC144103918 [Amblyomma americanum]